MFDEMDEIVEDFIVEAEETLERIEPMFVKIETEGYVKDILEEIFRGMHTLKGAASFLGFQQIIDVAHEAESIMKKLSEGEMDLSKGLIDVILKSVDTLRLIISHIKLKDGIEEDISGLLKELTAAQAPSTDTQSDAKPEFVPITEDAAPAPASTAAPVLPVPDEQERQITRRSEAGEQGIEKEIISNLRVEVSRIDKAMNLAGEIAMARNRLLNLAARLNISYSGDPYVEGLIETTSFLDRVTSDLQLAVMKMRMQPIQKVFGKFPRMARDLSRSMDKEIDLEIIGEDTEVDKTVIENIGDPLVHIIRNSIDHGIETKEERVIKNKPIKGKIVIDAYQKGTQIVIEVSDDGKGIDIEAVKKKALLKGLISEEEAEKMPDDAATNLIFLPGFSTKETSTELSGRGVGMDVVRTNVSKLNGGVEVITKKGVGSTFRISLPLTLATLHAIMVRVGDEHYAIPQSAVEETLRVKKDAIKNVTGQRVLTIRGRVLPMIGMSEFLGLQKVPDIDYINNHNYVLVVISGSKRLCISVDEVIGQEEVVIKAINGVEAEESGILGATITGDGRVVLILDPLSLSRGTSVMSEPLAISI
ncbi:chemotaxis protein CheA [Thermodesulfovibrionales bacterium]|nr:chemotaxis protein CheA [Thermodesulfovibrionales bacterium]MCL0071435.1 chemotaxis protein CheA [Thermodesulfovibrionales bacterium]